VSFGDNPDLTSEVVLLGARQAKGLEFDSVLIADPAEIIAASPRGRNDLYVAMTRSTQRLGILHPGPPPAEIAALRPRVLPGPWRSPRGPAVSSAAPATQLHIAEEPGIQ
jgi:hypothetical protein